MAHAYTPGLKVTPGMLCRSRRMLPIRGEVLVEKGQRVGAEDVVAQAQMEGEITPINVANLLSLPPADVGECMLKQEGEAVAEGESLARTKGIFGLFKRDLPSKAEGVIETISSVTGQVIIRGAPVPLDVLAYLAGEVVEVLPGEGCVIESQATFVQGIFGIGGEAFGPIVLACDSAEQDLTADRISAEMAGAVIVGGARMDDGAIAKAIEVGAAAVVAGGIDDQDLRAILGYDLGVAITGSERIGLTLLVTEGFGSIAMAQRTFEILSSRARAEASVNGTTQIRAGVMRPEILIPWGEGEAPEEQASGAAAGLLEVGRAIRVIREPYFGSIGEVSALPPEPRALESGSKARVLEAQFPSGERVVIPRANVELIEE